MSAILNSPPSGIEMRPFRLLTPFEATVAQYYTLLDGDPAEVICVGPLHDEGGASQEARRTFTYHGRAYYGDACTAVAGRHLMLWRVPQDPPRKPRRKFKSPRKLAHWDTLDVGFAMIVTPSPDIDSEDGVVSRAAYMRSKGRGNFQPFYDADGSLWVARLSDAQ